MSSQFGHPCAHRRTGGGELIIIGGGVDKEGRWRRDQGVHILAGLRSPLGKAEHGVVVRREPVHDDIVIAGEAGQAVTRRVDAPVRRIGVVKDVVKKRIAGAGILDVDGPAGVGGHQRRR